MYQRNPLLLFATYHFKKKLDVSVYYRKTSRDPHFHVHDHYEKGRKPEKNFFECCLAFEEPARYENHGTIDGKLSSSDKKDLMKFLTRNNKRQWKIMLYEWNKGEEHRQLSLNLPVPDYTKCY